MLFWGNKKEKEVIQPLSADIHNNDNDRFVTQYHSYCRTIALAHENDPRPVYWEAFCQDNSIDQWQLRQVMTRTKMDEDTGEEIEYHSYQTLKKDLDFQNAMHKLSQFERATNELNRYPVGKTAEELGSTHFVIVTEQEELLFDEKGYPHKVFTGHIPKTDGHFLPKDVQRAIKNHEMTKDLDTISHAKTNDATVTLARIFNTVVTNAVHFELALESINNLRILDITHDSLRSASVTMWAMQNTDDNKHYSPDRWSPSKDSFTANKLPFKDFVITTYENNYGSQQEYNVDNLPSYFRLLEQLGDIHKDIFDMSDSNPLKASIQNTAYINEAIYNIVYANHLFQESIEPSPRYLTPKNHVKMIRALQECAEEIFKTKLGIDNQKDIETMKHLILQSDSLEAPELIKNYLEEYKGWRSQVSDDKSAGIEQKISKVPIFPKLTMS